MDAVELMTIYLGMQRLLRRGAHDQNNWLGQTNQSCCCWLMRWVCFSMCELSGLSNVHWCCLILHTLFGAGGR